MRLRAVDFRETHVLYCTIPNCNYFHILEVIEQIKRGELVHLHLKKLEGKNSIYRVRKGDFRFICEKDNNGLLQVVDIARKEYP